MTDTPAPNTLLQPPTHWALRPVQLALDIKGAWAAHPGRVGRSMADELAHGLLHQAHPVADLLVLGIDLGTSVASIP